MELLDPQNPRLLTNIEVLKLIRSKLECKKKVRRQQTLLYTSAKYLNSKAPCSKQTEAGVQAFANEVKVYNLTKTEILMLINHCPSTQVELSVIISDLDSRLSNSQADQLLQLIEKHFPDGVAASQIINSTGTLEISEDNT
uniref:DNA-directed RNA polymerase III subunit RPC9 n=1 Tax=Schistosoma japonicum TaxID=6182 RepID=Q5DE86_SCHJA|nr:SJCHGC05325 protein [Schistosoma japonicum]